MYVASIKIKIKTITTKTYACLSGNLNVNANIKLICEAKIDKRFLRISANKTLKKKIMVFIKLPSLSILLPRAHFEDIFTRRFRAFPEPAVAGINT